MIKTLLHLSDLHFGTEKPGLVDCLIRDCQQINPDIIVVSGDLTQRARPEQYRAAKKFLANFNDKVILTVPGNHDISLYNIIERFCYPFAKYRQWICPDLCSHYADEHVAILGINSVTPYKPMGGYVTDKQLAMVQDYFKAQQSVAMRIVIMHHNLIRSERHKIINDADKILEVFADAGVNLVLSGHIHYPLIEQVKKSFVHHNMYVITAGTPISTRTIAPNSYNLISSSEQEFTLTVRMLTDQHFSNSSSQTYSLIANS